MAKNANKILKEIAVKMGGKVGEKDNDTNEFLTSIATSMGASLDKKHNTNELLEIIRDNISEGGSGGSEGGAVALPLGQTNPDCYFYKMFLKNNATLTIDFNKFADWYENLLNHGYTNKSFTDWESKGGYFTQYEGGTGKESILRINFAPTNYSSYIYEFLDVAIVRNEYDGDKYLYLTLYSPSSYYHESHSENIYLTKTDDRSVLEYIRQFGVITTNLADWYYTGSGSHDHDMVCYIHSICIMDIISNFGPYNNYIEFVNTIDWIKISENN